MQNYMEWKMMGVRKRLKPDAVPRKFACQTDRMQTLDLSVSTYCLINEGPTLRHKTCSCPCIDVRWMER